MLSGVGRRPLIRQLDRGWLVALDANVPERVRTIGRPFAPSRETHEESFASMTKGASHSKCAAVECAIPINALAAVHKVCLEHSTVADGPQ